MDKFDVVIIGSGLGGLQCGDILSREGFKVCIVEKNNQIGGSLQNFVRKNCIFDVGGHYAGSLGEGQILHRFFKYFGIIDKLKLKRLDIDGFDIINFENDHNDYKYSQGYDNFINSLSESFPEERENLISYCNKLKEISKNLPLFNLEEIKSPIIDSSYFKVSTADFIKSFTKNIKLQNVLAGTNLLYAGVPNKTPMYVHSIINNSFIESAWRFVDGTSQITELLKENIINNGGTILTNSTASHILFEGHDMKYLRLSNKNLLETKYIISNIHPAETLQLLDSDKIRKAYKSRINNLENTISVFTIYIVLKKNTFKYLNKNYYYYKNTNVWTTSTYNENNWPESFLFLTPANTKSDEYADCITVMAYMKYNEFSKWENTSIEKRGEEYKTLKKEKAEKLLDLIEKKFPGLRSKIESYYTSTPLTYRDYIATKQGSLYGILRDCNEPLKSEILPRTKIPNLFLTGQNVNMHGVLGVTIGSLKTCGEILGLNYLLNKIKNTEK